MAVIALHLRCDKNSHHCLSALQVALGATDVRFGSSADIRTAKSHVHFTPQSRHRRCANQCLLRAKSASWAYSITSSARASTDGGTVRPSALAVLRLITSSYLVGACTGRSAGFSPLRMRST